MLTITLKKTTNRRSGTATKLFLSEQPKRFYSLTRAGSLCTLKDLETLFQKQYQEQFNNNPDAFLKRKYLVTKEVSLMLSNLAHSITVKPGQVEDFTSINTMPFPGMLPYKFIENLEDEYNSYTLTGKKIDVIALKRLYFLVGLLAKLQEDRCHETKRSSQHTFVPQLGWDPEFGRRTPTAGYPRRYSLAFDLISSLSKKRGLLNVEEDMQYCIAQQTLIYIQSENARTPIKQNKKNDSTNSANQESLFSLQTENNLSCVIYESANSQNGPVIRTSRKYIRAVALFLRNNVSSQASTLVDVAATDKLKQIGRFSLKYSLLSTTLNSRTTIELFCDETLSVPSLAAPLLDNQKVFASAGWLEREVWDLFGIYFSEHGDLRRVLTDYGFTGHPLRKDFPLTGFYELVYNDAEGRVTSEPVELAQEFRVFSLT